MGSSPRARSWRVRPRPSPKTGESTISAAHERAPERALLAQTGPFETQSAPYGLGALGASLRELGCDVAIVDEATGVDASLALREALAAGPPPRLVGLSAKTPGVPRLLALARWLRAEHPEVPLVVGGPHASALPERTLADTGADAVAIGEADDTIRELLEWARGDRALADIAGIAHREGGGAVRTAPRTNPLDLDALPRPVWDRIGGFERYSRTPWQVLRKGRRIAPLATTRGCPYECTFCAVPNVVGRKLRRRSPESIVAEVEWLRRDFGVDELHVIDDLFNGNIAHAKGICEALARRGDPLPFKTPNGIRADHVDDELADLMRRAGCWQVGFGVESADDVVLDASKKRLDLGVVESAIERFHRHGISVFGYFILGLPGDDVERCLRSIDRMCALPFDHVHVSYCVPYPGTELFARSGLEVHGDDWSAYTHFTPFATSALSPDELRGLMRRALFRFYRRPSRAFRLGRDAWRGGPMKLGRLARKYSALG